MTDGFTRAQEQRPANTRETQCAGKTRFISFTAANIIAGKPRKERMAREPYRCRFCGGWHLGSKG